MANKETFAKLGAGDWEPKPGVKKLIGDRQYEPVTTKSLADINRENVAKWGGGKKERNG